MTTFLGQTRLDVTSGSTYPGPGSLLGALDMVKTSAANPPGIYGGCSYRILQPSTINCTDNNLGIPAISGNVNKFNLYPNPANGGNIIISYELNKNSIVQFKIFDYSGQEVMLLDNDKKVSGAYTENVNISELANGIYLFIANINGKCQIIKIIKL